MSLHAFSLGSKKKHAFLGVVVGSRRQCRLSQLRYSFSTVYRLLVSFHCNLRGYRRFLKVSMLEEVNVSFVYHVCTILVIYTAKHIQNQYEEII